jgi:hypothetical protein
MCIKEKRKPLEQSYLVKDSAARSLPIVKVQCSSHPKKNRLERNDGAKVRSVPRKKSKTVYKTNNATRWINRTRGNQPRHVFFGRQMS